MAGNDGSEHTKAGLIATALVAVLGLAAYWTMFYDMGFQSGQNERKANVEAEHYASDTANRIERECATKSGQAARKCIATIVAAERESQRVESDLAAQWKAANWVMWAGVLAGAQLIATAFGLYYIRETLRATLKAVKDTGEATEAMRDANRIASQAVRPWLRLLIDKYIVFEPGDGEHTYVFRPNVIGENFGNAPAVSIAMTVTLLRGHDFDIVPELERLTKIGETLGVYGQAIHPTDKQIIDPNMGYRADVLDFIHTVARDPKPPGHYLLGIAVFYRSPTSPTIFYTAAFLTFARTELPMLSGRMPAELIGGEQHGIVSDTR